MEIEEQCTGGRITKKVRRVQILAPLVGSGAESKRSVVSAEDSRVVPLPGGELESIFTYSLDVRQINIVAWVKEFHLPLCYEYRKPSKEDRACMPPPGYICVLLHSLQGEFRLPPLYFQAQFIKDYGVLPCFLLPNAWRTLNAFELACLHSGIEIDMRLFQALFKCSINKMAG